MIDVQSEPVNKKTDISPAAEAASGSPALLHEMMRSFTTLARTLNLSQAVEELSSTRQTVRRHISQLEAAMGSKLFMVENRRYYLTELGERAVTPAQMIIDQGEAWYQGSYDRPGGLTRFGIEDASGWAYHQQQQPMTYVWDGDSELLRAAVSAWSLAQGDLEHEEMQRIRPYIIVYRDAADSWICTEIGEESFYSKWYGWAQARSSVGRQLDQFPGGEKFSNLINIPFRDVQAERGIRLDQVVMTLPEDAVANRRFLTFDRLLMGVRLPDGSPALMSVVDRPTKLDVAGVDPTVLNEMPKDAAIEFTS